MKDAIYDWRSSLHVVLETITRWTVRHQQHQSFENTPEGLVFIDKGRTMPRITLMMLDWRRANYIPVRSSVCACVRACVYLWVPRYTCEYLYLCIYIYIYRLTLTLLCVIAVQRIVLRSKLTYLSSVKDLDGRPTALPTARPPDRPTYLALPRPA